MVKDRVQKFRKLSGKLPGRVRVVERGRIRERLQNTGDVPGMCRVMTSATSAEDKPTIGNDDDSVKTRGTL